VTVLLPWRRDVANAEQRLAEAEERRQESHDLVTEARAATERLATEIRKNGWTELFTMAMKGR
jgi:hypothetical protein